MGFVWDKYEATFPDVPDDAAFFGRSSETLRKVQLVRVMDGR